MSIHMMPDWQRYLNQVPQMDPTVHQVKLFLAKKEPVNLIVRDYLPKMRSLLAQNQLENITYWSAFDCLQNVNLKGQQPLDVADFTWPQGSQFVRMYDRVVVMLNQRHYATLWPAYPMADLFDRVDLFEENKIKQQLTLDDRGFVSRILNFENDSIVRIDYLTPSGDVVAQEDYQTGVVTTQQRWTNQATFPNMSTLISEITHRYLASLPANDLLIVSQTNRNVAVLDAGQIKQKLVMSYNSYYQDSSTKVPLASDLVVASQAKEARHLISSYSVQVPVQVIAPFASHPEQSRAASRDVLPIFWSNHEANARLRQAVMTQLIQLARRNPIVTIICESEQAVDDLQDLLNAEIKTMTGEDESTIQIFLAQFQFIPVQTEVERDTFFDTIHLLVTMDAQPDVYLQTLALSRGVPQISATENPYLIAGQNGQLVDDVNNLATIIQTYIDEPTIWLQSQDQAINLSYEFDSETLWQQWQKLLNQVSVGYREGEE